MEYEKYKKYFIWFKDHGSVDLNLAFRIKTNSANSDSAEDLASQIERDIEVWQELFSPGIRYTRDGLEFRIDLFAYKRDNHLDYFDRAFNIFEHRRRAGRIESIPYQLPEPTQ